MRAATDDSAAVAGEDCATTAGPPIEAMVAGLKHSAVWQRSRSYLRSEEYSEEWREGCYRFFCYAAEYEQAPATAVFAALVAAHHADYRMALVDEQSSTVLLQIKE